MTCNCKLVFGKLVCIYFCNSFWCCQWITNTCIIVVLKKTCFVLKMFKDAQVLRIKCLLFSGLGSRVPPPGCHQHPLLDRNTPAWAPAVAGQSSDPNGLPTQSHFLCVLMHYRTRGIQFPKRLSQQPKTHKALFLSFQWMFMVLASNQPGNIMLLNKQLCGQISVALFFEKKRKKKNFAISQYVVAETNSD